MELPTSYIDQLWRSPWRDIVGEHGLGSTSELLAGRGPPGLREAHLQALNDMTGLRVDETTCRLMERHGIDPVIVMAMCWFADTPVVSRDGKQILAIGRTSGRIAVDSWDERTWFSLPGAEPRGQILRLPPVPHTLAMAAAGRPVSAVVDNDAFHVNGMVVREMTTDETESTINATGLTCHDGPSLVRRDRRKRGYVVRPAVDRDLPDIVRLARTLNRHHAGLRPDILKPDAATSTMRQMTQALDKEDVLLVADDGDGDRVVGHAWGRMRRVEDDEANVGHARLDLFHLYVEPAMRRLGVGKALMDEIERLAGDHGAAHVELEVWKGNEAEAFYAAIGYAPGRLAMAKTIGEGKSE